MLLSCCLPLDGHLTTDSSDPNSYWLQLSIKYDPDPVLNVPEVRNSCWSTCYGDSYCFVLLMIVVWSKFSLGAVTYTADHVEKFQMLHLPVVTCSDVFQSLLLPLWSEELSCVLTCFPQLLICLDIPYLSLSWVVPVEHTWPNNHNAFQFAAAEQLKVNGDRNWNDSSELTPIDTSCDSFLSYWQHFILKKKSSHLTISYWKKNHPIHPPLSHSPSHSFPHNHHCLHCGWVFTRLWR